VVRNPLPVMDLRDAIAGRLADWRGLAGTETVDSVLAALAPVTEVQAPTDSERQQYLFRRIDVERGIAPPLVALWIAHGEETAALIEYDDPVAPEVDALLEAYQGPDLLLKGQRSVLGATVDEHVFAARGIALSIAEPYAEHRSRRIIRVQLFRPQSTSCYWRHIGPGPELRPSLRRSP
jgi:hypothetical protein